jgi:tetratricopeptide (TPR) repeat protein
LRGSALLGPGKRDDARALFDQALKEDKAMAGALLGLARIAFAEQRPAAAASLLGRALATHPGDADCLRFKGDMLRIEGRHAAAMAAHRALLALHPRNAQARVDVASLLIDEGEFAAARAELRAARKLSPGRLSVFYTQAMLDYREARYPAATESLQQILRGARRAGSRSIPTTSRCACTTPAASWRAMILAAPSASSKRCCAAIRTTCLPSTTWPGPCTGSATRARWPMPSAHSGWRRAIRR